jgi:hypothetical protein
MSLDALRAQAPTDVGIGRVAPITASHPGVLRPTFITPRRAAPAELRRLLQVETSRLVYRDATISLHGRRFAVPPELMGKHVWVGLLGDDITIEHAGRIVATYTT